MNKSALIFDTPEHCADCPLHMDDGNDTCFITKTVVTNEKRSECPLTDLPPAEVCNEYDFENYYNGVRVGWNRYLEKLIKEPVWKK